jgi:predicted ATP-dependent serine protease
MERLDAVLDRLHHGGEALVLRGEPGIRKSVLLRHASWRAAESGFRTLASVGVESDAELAVRRCATVRVYGASVIGTGQAALLASYHLRLIS